MNPYLLLAFGNAGLLGLWLESPYGKFLRGLIAGSPSDEQWEDWRVKARTAEIAGQPLPPEPAVARPRMERWLECPACAGFWGAGLLTWAYTSLVDEKPAWTLLWATAWVGGRILLGVARRLEEFEGE